MFPSEIVAVSTLRHASGRLGMVIMYWSDDSQQIVGPHMLTFATDAPQALRLAFDTLHKLTGLDAYASQNHDALSSLVTLEWCENVAKNLIGNRCMLGIKYSHGDVYPIFHVTEIGTN